MDKLDKYYPLSGPPSPRTARLRGGRASIERGSHRSTVFAMRFDISGLMDSEGRPLVTGDQLEAILIDYSTDVIRRMLNQARKAIPNHP